MTSQRKISWRLVFQIWLTAVFLLVMPAGKASPVHALKSNEDLAPLIEAAADARLILLGESTHGTSEFYSWRAEISRQLISQQENVRFVAVEGDWAALQRVNRYVLGKSGVSGPAADILVTFDRWPQWMWANVEFADFVEWLRDWNAERPMAERTAVYGLDLYGWADSFAELEQYLDKEAPGLAEKVKPLYDCLRPFLADPQSYARAAYYLETECKEPAQRVVKKLKAHSDAAPGNRAAATAMEHAHVVAGAERHYRAMAFGGAESWNARVEHMKSAIERRLDFYDHNARGIVWAHNTHVGDARASSMAEQGQRNMGQLTRQKLGADAVFIVGFSTQRGMLVAGDEWGSKPQEMQLPEAARGSLDALLGEQDEGPYWFLTAEASKEWDFLNRAVGHRAAGVVYSPAREAGNYVPTIAARRYDALIVLPKTRALKRL